MCETPKDSRNVQNRVTQRRKLARRAAVSDRGPLKSFATKYACTGQDSTMSDKEQLLRTKQLPQSYDLSNYPNSHGAGKNLSSKVKRISEARSKNTGTRKAES